MTARPVRASRLERTRREGMASLPGTRVVAGTFACLATASFLAGSVFATRAPVTPPASNVPAGAAVPGPDRDELRTRRTTLAGRVGRAVVLVLGARDVELEDFHQAKDFLYLTGVSTPDAALVLVARDMGEGEDPRTILFLPEHSASWERWNGPRLAPGTEAESRTGIDESRSATELETIVLKLLQRTPRLLVPDAPEDRDAPLPDSLAFLAEARQRNRKLQIESLRPHLTALRLVKSPAEIEAIEEAVRVTALAHREGAAAIGPDVPEYVVEGTIEGAFRRRGSTRPAFASIVGSGPNSCVLHYRSNDRTMQDGELVVVDVGAEWGGYAADLTRTYPVSGRFDDAQRAAYEAVLAAQGAAIAAVLPGATLHDVDRAARHALEEYGLAGDFWHGTSHFLGLDVHDVGSSRVPLEPGMVLTVEPGVYLPDDGFGIRIEDDVLVTEDGARVLSADLPRDVATIEAWVGRSP